MKRSRFRLLDKFRRPNTRCGSLRSRRPFGRQRKMRFPNGIPRTDLSVLDTYQSTDPFWYENGGGRAR